MDAIEREVLLSFWKVRILCLAESRPLYGYWVIREFRRHGGTVSPGMLYPLLARMERLGWLEVRVERGASEPARKEYSLTALGREVLAELRARAEALYREVVLGEEEGDPWGLRCEVSSPRPRGPSGKT